MEDKPFSQRRRGRPALPAFAIETYVVERLNAGETMATIDAEALLFLEVVPSKRGQLSYQVRTIVKPGSIAPRYREKRQELSAPWERIDAPAPIFIGRPLQMPASVTENTKRMPGRRRKKATVR